jgi:hypothetical protein
MGEYLNVSSLTRRAKGILRRGWFETFETARSDAPQVNNGNVFHLNSSATPPWGSRSLIWGVLSRDGGLECPQLRGAVMGRLGVGRLLFLMFLLHVPRE